MEQQIKDLWQTSFEDTDLFISLYFEHIYEEQHTLTIESGGRIVAALQVLPYEMSYCGTTVTMGYLCGACTLPSERGKGWMSRLMPRAIRFMRERNDALTALIPASPGLFDFYERFGYVKAFDYSLEIYSRTEPSSTACRIVPSSALAPEAVYAYFDRKQRERICSVLHTPHGWETICLDCIADDGNVWVALCDGRTAGIALALPVEDDGDTVFFKELLYEHPDVKEALIQFVLQYYHRSSAHVRRPPLPTLSPLPYGMAQVLDNQRMTDLYLACHPESEALFSGKANDDDALPPTQLLLAYDRRQAYLNLMLD
jgi:predicted acetyltransferase